MPEAISASDGTDYKYSKHDRDWRVRVRVNSELSAAAPVNGNPEVEAAGMGIVVSVALLDGDEVAKAPDGKLRIFPPHVLTIPAEAFGRVDPEAEIERVIDQQIDDANRQLKGKDQLHAALARFSKGA